MSEIDPNKWQTLYRWRVGKWRPPIKVPTGCARVLLQNRLRPTDGMMFGFYAFVGSISGVGSLATDKRFLERKIRGILEKAAEQDPSGR